MSAMRSGDIAVSRDAMDTTHMTDIRFTKYPVEMLVTTAVIRAGRIRSDAPVAEWPWTSWKLRDVSDDSWYI